MHQEHFPYVMSDSPARSGRVALGTWPRENPGDLASQRSLTAASFVLREEWAARTFDHQALSEFGLDDVCELSSAFCWCSVGWWFARSRVSFSLVWLLIFWLVCGVLYVASCALCLSWITNTLRHHVKSRNYFWNSALYRGKAFIGA